MFLSLIFFYLFFLLSVAYLTLLERHVLALGQSRLGPNKPLFLAFFLPVLDGFKLFKKQVFSPGYSSLIYYYSAPVFMFFLLFFYWTVFPYYFFFFTFSNSFLFFLCLVGSSVYAIFFTGYYSSSKYAYLGSIRSTSQSISFEVVFFFSTFSIMCLLLGLHFSSFLFTLFSVPLFFFWFFSILSELGRAPLDFTEGESELVSGYNIEYGGLLFVFIFLSEYGYLLFYSSLLVSVFFSAGFFFFLYMMVVFILLLRGALPRYRYDLLMGLFWYILLPVSMQILFLVVFLFLE